MEDKVSVIIPCHPPHLTSLGIMLDSLVAQTYLPDEVVVAMSEISGGEARRLEASFSSYPFLVRVLDTAKKQFPGQNRNRGAAAAAHEILVFCDADDECHKQKIEITRHIFSQYNPKLFLHGFKRDKPVNESYDLSNIPLVFTEKLLGYTFGNPLKREGSNFIFTDRPAVDKWIEGSHPAHGYAAVRREVFERVKYADIPIAEDVKFCLDVLWKFRSAIYADVKLFNYHYYKRFKQIMVLPD